MRTRHPARVVPLAASLAVLLALAPAATAAKKSASKLKDGRYTFKLTGRAAKMTVSGGGKKVRFSVTHFVGSSPGSFPYCQTTVVDHGTYTLKRDYVEKDKLAFSDPDLYARRVPAIETDGSAGGGMSAFGTIDPRRLTISGQFPIRMQDVAGGINTCFEGPTTDAAVKLTRVK